MVFPQFYRHKSWDKPPIHSRRSIGTNKNHLWSHGWRPARAVGREPRGQHWGVPHRITGFDVDWLAVWYLCILYIYIYVWIELSNLLFLSSGSLALLEWIETKSFCMRGRFKTICAAVLETVKVTPGGLLRLPRWLEVRIGLLNLPVILVKQSSSTHIFGLYHP